MSNITLFVVSIISLVVLILNSSTEIIAHQSEETTTFYIVRHTETNPPLMGVITLSKIGKQRAQDLAEVLKHKVIHAIYTSETLCDKETARSIAENKKLIMNTYDKENTKSFLQRILKQRKGQNVLIVGNIETVVTMLQELSSSFVPTSLDKTDHSILFEALIDANNVAGITRIQYSQSNNSVGPNNNSEELIVNTSNIFGGSSSPHSQTYSEPLIFAPDADLETTTNIKIENPFPPSNSSSSSPFSNTQPTTQESSPFSNTQPTTQESSPFSDTQPTTQQSSPFSNTQPRTQESSPNPTKPSPSKSIIKESPSHAVIAPSDTKSITKQLPPKKNKQKPKKNKTPKTKIPSSKSNTFKTKPTPEIAPTPDPKPQLPSLEEMSYNLNKNNLFLLGYDLISYFKDNKAVKGQDKYVAEHRGGIFRFSSKKNLNTFLENPEKNLPQYGGWCALGMSIEGVRDGYTADKYPADPENFKIIDDKLYLFYKTLDYDALQKWNNESNESACIQRANSYWKKINK